MLKINNNLLYKDNQPVTYFQTANTSNLIIKPSFIIVHWTANNSYTGAIKTLTNPETKVSAHFVIGRQEGQIAQLNFLNRPTWHAGTSEYKTYKSLNKHSVGIEFVNFGPLTKKNNKYFSWNNKEVPEEETILLSDKKYYHNLSVFQLEFLKNIIPVIYNSYPSVEEVISHKDVCIPKGRKNDIPDIIYNKKEMNELLK
jgi:N-acetylmuramoyl-L-alanine amidase